jgi:uncharacterized protein
VPLGADTPHLPHPAIIEAYGDGGFRFAAMSHRGSLLCLPDGIWAWPVAAPQALTTEHFALPLARARDIDHFILGSGGTPWIMPEMLRAGLREAGLRFEIMLTGPAVRTYNIMLGERRRVAAGLIAVA